MIRIGITGEAGFIGTHLYNTFGLYPDKYQRIKFKDSYFQDEILLKDFVSQCDIIVHLAALNRHNDPQIIYETNIKLVRQVINACESTNSTPFILFSSSSQEERDNLYGKSKKEGRILFEQWAYKVKAKFIGLIIPNVFGPFGLPYYNSVVATFCHQLTHHEQPKIEIDGLLKLIYINELVKIIIDIIEEVFKKDKKEALIEQRIVNHTYEAEVSTILRLLEMFRDTYFEKGELPALDSPFDKNLFNTFICYIDHSTFFPFKLELKTDERGSFVETVRLNSGGQISFSTTLPGVTRGNHYHTRKAERFAVIKGRAKIELRRIGTENLLCFELDGAHPSFVDMPVWYTHNITNIGNEDLYTIFWINEKYDIYDPDTYYEKV